MTPSLRSAARSAVESVLVGSGAAARSRRKQAGGAAILAYHNVVPHGLARPGDASLHLGVRDFRAQLDRLVETHHVVPLAEAVETSSEGSGTGRRPAAAITFDDGYRGVLRHAVPELVRRTLPATVFVCPGLLGADGFWWDRVFLAADGPPPNWRSRAIEDLGGRQEAVLNDMSADAVPDVCRPVSEAELHELANAPGITLASHTWSHPNLTETTGDELEDELSRPAAWLAENVAGAHLAGHVSFPYGLWNERVRVTAERAGYRFLYRVEGGVARRGGTSVVPRINIPAGVSVRGFELRASGLRR